MNGPGLGVRILRQRRPVGGRHHLDHAGMRLGGGHIESATRPRAMLLTAQHGVEHARRMVVGGVARARR